MSSAERNRSAGLPSTWFTTADQSWSVSLSVASTGPLQHELFVSASVTPSASHSSPDMFATSESNGSSVRGRMRSTFHAWKNSWAAVSNRNRGELPSEALLVSTLLLRCSIPSPTAHGR